MYARGTSCTYTLGGSRDNKSEDSDSQLFCCTNPASLSRLLCYGIANIFASVIGAVTAELVVRNMGADSADRTFTSWRVVICSQFVQALSIITACVPYLKPFFSSLETGMIRADDSRRLESRSIWSSHSKQRSTTRTKKSVLSTMSRSSASRPGASTVPSDALHEDYTLNTHVIGGRNPRTDDTGSQTSRTKILKQTDIWVGSA